MHYDFIAIPDAEIPQAVEPVFQHVVTTYASEANKTVSMWRAVPDDSARLQAAREDEPDPHHPGPPASLRAPLLRSVRRHARSRPSKNSCRPARSRPCRRTSTSTSGSSEQRLPQLAAGTTAWWLEQRPFFGGLQRERIWVFWRRVLHTCHHRTQVQTWLRLAGQHVPAIYGPSGDVKWDEADPTYSLEAAKRGG